MKHKYSIDQVDKVARTHGFGKVDQQENIGLVSYTTDGIKVNVYLSKMTVVVCADRKNITHKKVSLDELGRIFIASKNRRAAKGENKTVDERAATFFPQADYSTSDQKATVKRNRGAFKLGIETVLNFPQEFELLPLGFVKWLTECNWRWDCEKNLWVNTQAYDPVTGYYESTLDALILEYLEESGKKNFINHEFNINDK